MISGTQQRMTGPGQPWSVPVRPEEIPETGRRLELEASEATRAAVAKAAGVGAVLRLAACFDLVRHGCDGVRVAGTVSAIVRQTCVVTLEPVTNEVAELVDVIFAPRAAPHDRIAEIDLPVGGAEPAEALVDGVVDLGGLATEFLILGIDPYPRKPGAVFEPPPSADAGGKPFASLSALKTARAKPR